jgi:hypothetical protein
VPGGGEGKSEVSEKNNDACLQKPYHTKRAIWLSIYKYKYKYNTVIRTPTPTTCSYASAQLVE